MIVTIQYNKEGSVNGDAVNTKHLEFSESEVDCCILSNIKISLFPVSSTYVRIYKTMVLFQTS